MKDRRPNFHRYFSFIAPFIVIVNLSSCHNDQSAVKPSPPQTASVAQPVATASPVATAAPAAPASNKAANKPATPSNVPEIMRRPMTGEEMKKAMEQLPPEVRARLQGMGLKPANPSVTPTPKK